MLYERVRDRPSEFYKTHPRQASGSHEGNQSIQLLREPFLKRDLQPPEMEQREPSFHPGLGQDRFVHGKRRQRCHGIAPTDLPWFRC